MFDALGGVQQAVALTLYTDAFVIHGTVDTRQRRVTDILNNADDRFLVLSDVTFDELGPSGRTVRAEYAQVNLASILFAVADTPVEPAPELRTPKSPELALISVPPFAVIGRIHLMPERSLRASLSELTGHFIPVTDATYWSDSLGEARTSALLVAVNHDRAQLLAPHHEVDPWVGLDRPPLAEGTPGPAEEPDDQRPATPDSLGW